MMRLPVGYSILDPVADWHIRCFQIIFFMRFVLVAGMMKVLPEARAIGYHQTASCVLSGLNLPCSPKVISLWAEMAAYCRRHTTRTFGCRWASSVGTRRTSDTGWADIRPSENGIYGMNGSSSAVGTIWIFRQVAGLHVVRRPYHPLPLHPHLPFRICPRPPYMRFVYLVAYHVILVWAFISDHCGVWWQNLLTSWQLEWMWADWGKHAGRLMLRHVQTSGECFPIHYLQTSGSERYLRGWCM